MPAAQALMHISYSFAFAVQKGISLSCKMSRYGSGRNAAHGNRLVWLAGVRHWADRCATLQAGVLTCRSRLIWLAHCAAHSGAARWDAAGPAKLTNRYLIMKLASHDDNLFACVRACCRHPAHLQRPGSLGQSASSRVHDCAYQHDKQERCMPLLLSKVAPETESFASRVANRLPFWHAARAKYVMPCCQGSLTAIWGWSWQLNGLAGVLLAAQ